MKIHILFFAILKERLGQEFYDLDLKEGQTVSQALAALAGLYPQLAALLPRVQVAVNRQMTTPNHILIDGDELALIPPVSGGAGARSYAVTGDVLSLDAVVAAVLGAEQGAVVTFTGAVRRHGQLQAVKRLEYEAFVPMAEAALCAIIDEIEGESPGVRVAIHHRIGTLQVGESAVVIAVSAPHRAEAFAACRVAIERLKQRVPIWKKEISDDGAVWIGMGP